MKNFQNIKQKPSSRSRGFTLVEMIMVVGIFLFTFVGVMLGVQVFGLRIYTLEATKLVATQGARTALNAIRDQIREAKNCYVGNCASEATNAFTLIAVTNIQQGNALIVYPTTNTSAYVVYYLDTSGSIYGLNQFNVTNGQIVYTNQLALYITNLVIFDAESWQTGIATNYTSLDNREIIHVTLQFSQWQYPIAFVGGHDFNAYDYYQLRTRVFRRAWN
jgi:prepilin-type N-terminal cleavage/methylation domain-containing protein